jgi:hypothetical protein
MIPLLQGIRIQKRLLEGGKESSCQMFLEHTFFVGK